MVPGSRGCGSAVFAIRATFTPSRATRVAMASPIPRLPPDMNITRSFSMAAAYVEIIAARRARSALALQQRKDVLGELVQEARLVLARRVQNELVEAEVGVTANARRDLLGV